ncbi:hypothetical protein QBC35DRAFT_507891 [Podospora australis]|uniref:Uncharacterized protein n=1 Tax=Podospora australis TaxID=1536484 RepID=A0AAN7ADT9_9PEZI|nr:hypothetical protein QBC35DRAFT_507891 [Podospora australis]
MKSTTLSSLPTIVLAGYLTLVSALPPSDKLGAPIEHRQVTIICPHVSDCMPFPLVMYNCAGYCQGKGLTFRNIDRGTCRFSVDVRCCCV